MPVPNTTSAEALDRYAMGRRIVVSQGPAWQEIRLSVLALPPVSDRFTMPAVTEPFIAWTASGEAEAQEREANGPWVTNRLKKGSLFLTTGGAPYDFRFRTLTSEPFEVVLVVLGLTLFNEALTDVFGKRAAQARVRDLSGFEDTRTRATSRSSSARRPASLPPTTGGSGRATANGRQELRSTV